MLISEVDLDLRRIFFSSVQPQPQNLKRQWKFSSGYKHAGLQFVQHNLPAWTWWRANHSPYLLCEVDFLIFFHAWPLTTMQSGNSDHPSFTKAVSGLFLAKPLVSSFMQRLTWWCAWHRPWLLHYGKSPSQLLHCAGQLAIYMCISLAPRTKTVVFCLGTRLRVCMCTKASQPTGSSSSMLWQKLNWCYEEARDQGKFLLRYESFSFYNHGST